MRMDELWDLITLPQSKSGEASYADIFRIFSAPRGLCSPEGGKADVKIVPIGDTIPPGDRCLEI